jgi:hypothetical protein
MVVKDWEAKDGCKSCADARRIMEGMTRISGETNAKAINKIREKETRIKDLEAQLKAITEAE